MTDTRKVALWSLAPLLIVLNVATAVLITWLALASAVVIGSSL